MDLVNGAVPVEQLEDLVARIRRDPFHPGQIIRDIRLGDSMTVEESARLLEVDRDQWARVLYGEAPITADLALRLEAVGWTRAELWMNLQSTYDLAQARMRPDHAAA